jgi:phosphoenolpyruvate carboxykinase (ATP)
VQWNLDPDHLLELAVQRGEGTLTREGALAVRTGEYTGRSPRDKYTTARPPSNAQIDWESSFNQWLAPNQALSIGRVALRHAAQAAPLYGFRGSVGRGRCRLRIAVITELAWHALMARHMFIPDEDHVAREDEPEFTLLYLPSLRAVPNSDGVRSEVVILCDLERRFGLIGGTQYGGEQKKFFFYLMNYILPQDFVFPMHCSANVGASGDVCVIFGLSGTGKTTLSADPSRRLLGDDEHGWDRDGVFNFEGGCYAKLIRLSREKEPVIWSAVNRRASILENVPVRDGVPDFEDGTVENTRGVYPLDALPNLCLAGRAGHPSTVVFLTFDASGTLPPISILDETQALYWFLAGYTAKVAGTERGLRARAEPTFSACFGAPFLPLPPNRYLELFRERLRAHRPAVLLMNTGAVGGPLGAGGSRPPIEATRALLAAAQKGELHGASLRRHPSLGLTFPTQAGGVPETLLDPAQSWQGDAAGYEAHCAELVEAFDRQVTQKYRGRVSDDVLSAAPGPAV